MDRLNIQRTDFKNPDFKKLVTLLDADLAIRDGDEHSFYDQFNSIEGFQYVVVLYGKNKAVSCGAIKPYGEAVMEVKRMYTLKDERGKGLAAKVLLELEKWAVELRMKRCVLETGIKQPEAIALYTKMGYHLIPNYGQYKNAPNSRCFEKVLSQ